MLRSAMALAISLLLIAPALAQGPKPAIFPQLFPNPTGQNGYEDYVRAADMANDDMVEVFIGRPGWESDLPAIRQKQDQVAQSLQAMDYLAIQKAAVQRYGKALDLIVAGNLKPSASPHDPVATQRFPELRPFSHLADLLVAKAYVQSASGDVSGGVKTLLDTLTFAHRFSGLAGIGTLYANQSEQAVFSRFLEFLPAMTLKDTAAVERYVDNRLQEPVPLAGFVTAAKKAHDFILDQALKDPSGLRAASPDDEKGYRDRMAELSDQDVATVVGDLRKLSDDRYEQMLADAQRPENELYGATEGWAESPPKVLLHPGSSLDDVAAALFYRAAPTYRNYALVELVRRTQLRLLSLQARIVDYRWHNHRLPSKLSDAVPDALAYDPLSGEPFVYELSGTTYRLYSKGRPKTGPVELRYERPESPRPALP